MMFFICILLPLLIMFSRKLWKDVKPVPKVVVITLLIIFLISFGMWISTYYMPQNLYWRGFRSHRIIFSIAGISSMLFYLLYPERHFRPFITLPMTIVAFCVGVMTVLVLTSLIYSDNSVFYSDSKFRIEKPVSIIYVPGLPDLFVKEGLLEKSYRIGRGENDSTMRYRFLHRDMVTKTEVKELADDKVSITFYHSDTAIKVNPLTFIVDLK